MKTRYIISLLFVAAMAIGAVGWESTGNTIPEINSTELVADQVATSIVDNSVLSVTPHIEYVAYSEDGKEIPCYCMAVMYSNEGEKLLDGFNSNRQYLILNDKQEIKIPVEGPPLQLKYPTYPGSSRLTA